MALATRCPHCQTTFRVAHDQLKLRAGLVRCGACKEIFNGVEHLLRPEEVQKPSSPSRPPTATSSDKPAALPPRPESASGFAAAQEPSFDPPEGAAPEEALPPYTPDHAKEIERPEPVQATRLTGYSQKAEDPLQRMTLMDFTAFEEEREEAARHNVSKAGPERAPASTFMPQASGDAVSYADSEDELTQAIDDLQRKPWRRAKTSSSRRTSKKGASAKRKEATEPAFVQHARWQKKYGRRMQIGMMIGSLLLLISLSLQGIYAFRNTIAAQVPESRPYLADFCGWLACKVNLPAQIDKVSIESSELHSLSNNPNQFTLSVLLNNQAAVAQAWPDIELTLNDTNEKPIARKVFTPQDYLASKEIESGFSAESEKTVKVSFELLQLKASGYRVYLFYP